MTTESPRTTATGGGSALLGAALVALVTGLLLVLVGAFVGGSPAAYGALVGTVIVVGVFALGAGVVHVAAASLLVALLTYTLQVLLLAVVFLAIERSGLADDTLDRRWLAGAVIAGTLAWMIAQIVLAARLRLPAYDLGDPDFHDRPEAGAR